MPQKGPPRWEEGVWGPAAWVAAGCPGSARAAAPGLSLSVSHHFPCTPGACRRHGCLWGTLRKEAAGHLRSLLQASRSGHHPHGPQG